MSTTFVKIGISEELRAAFEKYAARTGLSLASIIRDKLEDIIDHQLQYDRETYALGNVVRDLAKSQAESTGVPWHEHPAAQEALLAAIQAYMGAIAPPSTTASEYPYDPKTVGALSAKSAIHVSLMVRDTVEAWDAWDAEKAGAGITSGRKKKSTKKPTKNRGPK